MAPYDLISSIDARPLEKRYFDFPNSMDPLTEVFRIGLVPVALFSIMSVVSVTVLLAFITQRLISWRKHYRQYVGYNQYVILIYNLLIADLQQSIAFSISFHWLKIGKILAPTTPCFIQAWLLQIGNVASGFFVLAIAVHTWLAVVKGYKLPYLWFVLSIVLIWVLALLLTILGPALYHDRYFGRAGGWCWVSVDFQRERLWLHYIWIFIVEFGTIIIYAHIFIHLRGRIRTIIVNGNTNRLTRATKFMIMYPAVYVILTLPIAVGRMIALTGTHMPDMFFCVAGCLLTSCGWIDAVLYTFTRRILTHQEHSTGQYNHTPNTVTATATNAVRPGDDDHFGLQSMTSKEPINATSRTVTIVGGSNRLSRIVEHRRGRTHTRLHTEGTPQEDSPTRSGSQDSIYKPAPLGNAINIVTETNIQVEAADDKFDMGRPRSKDWDETEYQRR